MPDNHLEEFTFQRLPLNYIQEDEYQPRGNEEDYGTKGEKNRMFLSIKEGGIKTPLVVKQIDETTYRLIDGHRRYKCALRLNLPTVPCIVYQNLNEGELELSRFEIQNITSSWKPNERAKSLKRIKETNNLSDNKELAKFLHFSESIINKTFQVQDVLEKYKDLLTQYGLDKQEAYLVEFSRLQPKIRPIKEFSVDEIVKNIFDRVRYHVITSAKEFRQLGSVFLRAQTNQEEIYKYLKDQDMTVEELSGRTVRSGRVRDIESQEDYLKKRNEEGKAFPDDEVQAFQRLFDRMKEVLKFS